MPGFPNFFNITGPERGSTNIPAAAQVQFITRAIDEAGRVNFPLIEATHEAEREYSALCEKLAANSMF